MYNNIQKTTFAVNSSSVFVIAFCLIVALTHVQLSYYITSWFVLELRCDYEHFNNDLSKYKEQAILKLFLINS
jgi:hypothetical protein